MLVYAVDEDSPFHAPCLERVSQARGDVSPAFLTWSICYEFLRVTTHPRVMVSPWALREAWGFLEALLASPGFEVLSATPRHAAVAARVIADHADARGSFVHDLHTAVLMREHGISRICTRDRGFLRFPFLAVVDPLGESRRGR